MLEKGRGCILAGDETGKPIGLRAQERGHPRFEVEKASLRPLEAERFDPPSWAKCTVHPDHHIQFGGAICSVPTRYVGKALWVRADRRLVRVFFNGELIKVHPRKPPGGRSTDYDDYPASSPPMPCGIPNE